MGRPRWDVALHDDDRTLLADDPLWFRDAVIYEVPVRAFFDSNGDGNGDLAGLVAKLDYIKDLGVTAIWILPFYPSPLRDGGYDISDYRTVHPAYGDLADFKRLLREAHRRGIRVITELVINHTSSDHPWFQRARRAPKGSKWRDFYVWSDTIDRYPGVRVIFQDFEASNWTWDPVAGAFYWHRFYHHQPDLNFDHPDVQRELYKVLDHWLEMGVDGLRLDAIPYLYERDGTNCENLPETHAFLKELRAHVDARFKNRMLLAEANQWPEDAAAYFGQGDECHMNFHFPLMPRLFMAVELESSFPVVDILAQTPPIPESCQWAVFLRNHDELTLEMVTDEDRDMMYRVYAEDPQARINLGIRRRLAPLMGARRRVELMTALLLSMPGTPVLYYGDEIGMGDHMYLGDRDGVRTPMQWSDDRCAGFSTVNPQRLYLPTVIDPEFHYMTVNVDAQQRNPASLLWWNRRMIALRRRYAAFGRGDLKVVACDNGHVLAFTRTWQWQTLLVVANMSRTPQRATLDLSAFAGLVPVELLGQTPWPALDGSPFLVTLSPHAFFWFSLDRAAAPRPVHHEPGDLGAVARLDGVRDTALHLPVEAALATWLPEQRWFRTKGLRTRDLGIVDEVRLDTDAGPAVLLLVRVDDVGGGSTTYAVPLAVVEGSVAARLSAERPGAVLGQVEVAGRPGLLVDGMQDTAFADALLACLVRRRAARTDGTTLLGAPARGLGARLRGRDTAPRLGALEQSNHSVTYGDRVILKLLRVVEPGVHPEEELGRRLSDLGFPHVPRLEGTLTLRTAGGGGGAGGSSLLAIAHELLPAQGDAWTMTLDAVVAFLERAHASGAAAPPREGRVVDRARRPVPPVVAELLGAWLPLVRQLGTRTAELHRALSAPTDDPAFTPEPLTVLTLRGMYQAARTATVKMLARLDDALPRLEPHCAELAREVAARRDELDARLRRVYRHRLDAVRTRVHGDLHLGQVLYTTRDFVFLDFEGEPSRPLGERRLKRSPLRDVAGLLRSLRYAAGAVVREGRARTTSADEAGPWLDAWGDWTTAALLGSWVDGVAGTALAPHDPGDLQVLLDYHLLEKCVYEVVYELDHRPDWVSIPLRGLVAMLDR